MKNIRKKSLISFHTLVQTIACFVLFFSVPPIVSANSPSPNFKKSLTILNSKINHSAGKDEGCGYVSCIGHLKNNSDVTWEELVFEIQFFNSQNELIDTFTEYTYGMVVPPNEEIAFRIKDGADKNPEEYHSHKVRITSAKQVHQYTSGNSKRKTFIRIMISWAPMLLLIAVWIFFMRKYQGKNSPQEKIVTTQEKQISLIENQNKLFEELIEVIKNKQL